MSSSPTDFVSGIFKIRNIDKMNLTFLGNVCNFCFVKFGGRGFPALFGIKIYFGPYPSIF